MHTSIPMGILGARWWLAFAVVFGLGEARTLLHTLQIPGLLELVDDLVVDVVVDPRHLALRLLELFLHFLEELVVELTVLIRRRL